MAGIKELKAFLGSHKKWWLPPLILILLLLGALLFLSNGTAPAPFVYTLF